MRFNKLIVSALCMLYSLTMTEVWSFFHFETSHCARLTKTWTSNPLMSAEGDVLRFSTPYPGNNPPRAPTESINLNLYSDTEDSDVNETEELSKEPIATENRFAHDEASKAKISAANKGKPAWNLGVNHSEITKKKIAESMRKFAEEKAMREAAAKGMTLAEYELWKKQVQRERAREQHQRRKSRTTSETKLSRSDQMRKNWMNPEIRNKYINCRNRTISLETREKISTTIKGLWEIGVYDNNRSAPRQRRPRSPKNTTAEEANGKEKRTRRPRSLEWRQKISEVIKSKWQDSRYRETVVSAIRQKVQGVPRVNTTAVKMKKVNATPEERAAPKKKSPRKTSEKEDKKERSTVNQKKIMKERDKAEIDTQEKDGLSTNTQLNIATAEHDTSDVQNNGNLGNEDEYYSPALPGHPPARKRKRFEFPDTSILDKLRSKGDIID